MNDTQVILQRIAALRQRLDQAQDFVHDAGTSAAVLEHEATDPVRKLENKVEMGAWHSSLIDESVNEIPGAAPGSARADADSRGA